MALRGLRKGESPAIQEILEKEKEGPGMVYAIERIMKNERKQGKIDGFKEGEIKGEIKGKIEGKTEESYNLLIKLLFKKFGLLPKELCDKLKSVNDIKVYESLIENIFEIQSLEAVWDLIARVNQA